MNNDIKEILEEIKSYTEHEYLPPCCELAPRDCKLLLNYIINLQKQLSQFASTINELGKSNVDLQKKINRLLDSRDKLITYIKTEYESLTDDTELLNILEGSDKDE